MQPKKNNAQISAILPVSERWAQFGPRKKNWLINIPKGGICISAFIIASNNDSILLGIPRAGDWWPERGGEPLWRAREMEKTRTWVLPASHLLIGESPELAARRIAKDFIGSESANPNFAMVQSHTRQARLWWNVSKEVVHWDLCFVYDLKLKPNQMPAKRKPLWKELRFFPRKEIPYLKIGRGHADILEEGGYF